MHDIGESLWMSVLSTALFSGVFWELGVLGSKLLHKAEGGLRNHLKRWEGIVF